MMPRTLEERIEPACCQLALIVAAVNAHDPTVLDVPADEVLKAVFSAPLDALKYARALAAAPYEVLACAPSDPRRPASLHRVVVPKSRDQ
jgi:hypothetical protein